MGRAAAQESGIIIMMKYNPFRPNSMVNPGMFCGRENELVSIKQSLFQTKHGNPKHFLIEGERGIGKSSLMLYVQWEASGRPLILRDTTFRFIVVSVELGGGMTAEDIIRRIGGELKAQISEMQTLRTLAKAAWDFLSNWKLLGIEYKKEAKENDGLQATEDMARVMAQLIKASSQELDVGQQLDGILVLIDEADKPSEEARLGEFLKLLTERLTKLDCHNVCFGLAGLPSLIPKLRGSHESSPRLFETLHLQTLEPAETKDVILRGLSEAKEKNGYDTEISQEALNLLAHLAEGYPHFIQQFAHSAYNEDKDNLISDDDVWEGAFKENGALAQLAARYFHELYFDKISSDDYRRVLHSMTEHLGGWVSRAHIVKNAKIKESQVNNALNALKSRGIILINPEKAGEYRLPSTSFAVWLRALEKKDTKSAAG